MKWNSKWIPTKGLSATNDIGYDRRFESEKIPCVAGKIVEEFLLNELPRDCDQGPGGACSGVG